MSALTDARAALAHYEHFATLQYPAPHVPERNAGRGMALALRALADEHEAALADYPGGEEGFQDAIASTLFEVESKHQIHGDACLCGFRSPVARDRTAHITRETLKALLGEDALDDIKT